MSRLLKRSFGFYKLNMCGLMLALCHLDALCVLVSFCQRLLNKSVVVYRRGCCVHTDLGSDYDPPSVDI